MSSGGRDILVRRVTDVADPLGERLPALRLVPDGRPRTTPLAYHPAEWTGSALPRIGDPKLNGPVCSFKQRVGVRQPCSKSDTPLWVIWDGLLASLGIPLRKIRSSAMYSTLCLAKKQIWMAVAGTGLIWMGNRRPDLALYKNVRRRRRRRRRDEE